MMTDDSQRSPTPALDVSERVLQEVAETRGVPADRIDPPLFDVVDPDALNQLFEGRGSGRGPTGRIEFTLADCRVVVESTGEIDVTPLSETRERALPCG